MRKYLKTILVLPLLLPATLALARHRDQEGGGRQTAGAVTTQGSADRVFELPLPDGSRQTVLLASPPHPRGTIVMLPGGSGDVGLERDGDIKHDDNFVVRTRGLWNGRGYAVLIPDTIGHANLRGHRSSLAYARVVDELVGFAHGQLAGPVFLLGTSQGSIAAMNGAAHAANGAIAGVVLTESVSVMGGSKETVFSADPQQVRAPALVVANRDDRCNVAPPQAAQRIAASMTASHDVRVLMVAGVSVVQRRSVDRSRRTATSASRIRSCLELTTGWRPIADTAEVARAEWYACLPDLQRQADPPSCRTRNARDRSR